MLTASDLLSVGPNPSSSPLVPASQWQGMCVNCKTQPQAEDPATGSYYLFCSKSCAAANTLPSPPTSPGSADGLNTSTVQDTCDYCKVKQRYTDGVTVHPYCGRTCANLAKTNQPSKRNAPVFGRGFTNPSITSPAKTTNPFAAATTSPTQSTNLFNSLFGGSPNPNSTRRRNSGFSVYSNNTAGQICQIPGCASPVYVSEGGTPGKYCTKAHRELGESGCVYCREAPMSGSVIFCQSCYNDVLSTAPMIVEVPEDHRRFKSVASQFKQKWLHSNKPPEVHAVYKIVNTSTSVAKYDQYLNRVEAKGNFASQNKTRGNENRRWHGTTRRCNIGDKGVTNFCSDTSCSLCCIMKTSFDLTFFGKRTNFGRFGKGIYTSATSSKSDGYSYNACTSGWKAMLLNKVVVGRGYKTKADKTGLVAAPAGFDSVLAEVGSGLNYDELVVYTNDAIRPSYLVMYG